MIGLKKVNTSTSEKKNFIWNMLGSGIYAASSMILSIFVIKIVGANEGGIFSIAITLSQMLVYIAYFEMRTFLVTDSKNEYSFSEYHSSKIILCIAMLIISVIYVLNKDYSLKKMSIILLVCFSRLLDGYADVYEAQFQKCGRLDLAGKSMAYRTILFSSAICMILVITHDLVITLVVADVVALIGVWVFDIKVMKILDDIEPSYRWDAIKKIIAKCFPLFLGVFCWTYILSASRIAIDIYMSSEYQAYYQIIFMPVSVVSLFSGFVFRPLLPNLSEKYNMGNYKAFKKILYKEILAIIGITIVCMVGVFSLGVPILTVLSGCDLNEYRNILVFLQLAGGFNALAYAMYYILTIMRCSKSILIGYGVAAVLAFGITNPFVKEYGINGAAFSFFIVVVTLCLLFSGLIVRQSVRKKKN